MPDTVKYVRVNEALATDIVIYAAGYLVVGPLVIALMAFNIMRRHTDEKLVENSVIAGLLGFLLMWAIYGVRTRRHLEQVSVVGRRELMGDLARWEATIESAERYRAGRLVEVVSVSI